MTIEIFVAFGAFCGPFSDQVASLTNFLLQLRIMSFHNERIADIALNERESQKPARDMKADMCPVALEICNIISRDHIPLYHQYMFQNRLEWRCSGHKILRDRNNFYP